MKVKCIKQVEQTDVIEILGATILSVEEAESLPTEMRAIGRWWWLRTPGNDPADNSPHACDATNDGRVYYSTCYRVDYTGSVRPALKINLKSSNLKINDKILFGDKWFTIISDELALCDTLIGKCYFRKDWKAKDGDDYEKSDIKKFVDGWFNSVIQELEGEVYL